MVRIKYEQLEDSDFRYITGKTIKRFIKDNYGVIVISDRNFRKWIYNINEIIDDKTYKTLEERTPVGFVGCNVIYIFDEEPCQIEQYHKEPLKHSVQNFIKKFNN